MGCFLTFQPKSSCATVGFAEISSSNTVGYQTLNNNEQIVMMGCQFADVADGTSGVKLGDVKGEFTDFDLIEIMSCDSEGVLSSEAFTYLTLEGTGVEDGWYDGEFSLVDDVRIPVGAAVWFTSIDEAKGLTIAGEVYGGTYTHTFTTPISMICSAFPLPFNPNDTTKVSWTGVLDFDLIEVASCDDSGVISSEAYTYLTLDGTGVDDGWYDGDLALVESPIAIAGQGFWLTLTDPESVTMVEYSPLSK